MAEECLAFQYREGVGLYNQLNVKILNSGNYKIAEKDVGNNTNMAFAILATIGGAIGGAGIGYVIGMFIPLGPLMVSVFGLILGGGGGAILGGLLKNNKVYTGFVPSMARTLAGAGKYIAVFDFDTDVQLDISEVFEKLDITLTPSETMLRKKIMSGSMWAAAKRTRDKRGEVPWWQTPTAGWAMVFIAFILLGYFYTHINPNFVTVDVAVHNGTYTQAINNSANGNLGGGLINSTKQIIGHIP